MKEVVLKNRWMALCHHFDADPDRAAAAYRQLKKHYVRGLGKYRFYHTLLEHVGHMLEEFDEAWHLAENPYAVEFAIFLHDAVCNPRKKDNEEKSTELVDELVGSVIGHLRDGSEGKLCDGIKEIILDTKHQTTPRTNDGKLLVDIDLAILGSVPDVFETYDRNIACEYAFHPGETYRKGRAQVLGMFLKRKPLYYTDHFRKKYYAQARINLTRKVAELDPPK